MAVCVAMWVAGAVIVLMFVLVAVTEVMLMVVVMKFRVLTVVMRGAGVLARIMVGAVSVAWFATLITAVVPPSIWMLRASAIPVTKGLQLLIGLHATMVQGSGSPPQESRQVPSLPGSAPCLVLTKPGFHHKPGSRATEHHLLTGDARGEGTAKGTVWPPAAVGTLMLS